MGLALAYESFRQKSRFFPQVQSSLVVDVAQGKELSVVVHITVSKTVIQDLLQQTEDSLRLIAGELKGGHWLRDMGFTGQSDQTVST